VEDAMNTPTRKPKKRVDIAAKRKKDDAEFIETIKRARQERSKGVELIDKRKKTKNDRMKELLSRASEFNKRTKKKVENEPDLSFNETGGDKPRGSNVKNTKGNKNLENLDRL
jgi:hypothetical protein